MGISFFSSCYIRYTPVFHIIKNNMRYWDKISSPWPVLFTSSYFKNIILCHLASYFNWNTLFQPKKLSTVTNYSTISSTLFKAARVGWVFRPFREISYLWAPAPSHIPSHSNDGLPWMDFSLRTYSKDTKSRYNGLERHKSYKVLKLLVSFLIAQQETENLRCRKRSIKIR